MARPRVPSGTQRSNASEDNKEMQRGLMAPAERSVPRQSQCGAETIVTGEGKLQAASPEAEYQIYHFLHSTPPYPSWGP